jgi:pimeloyl-ACP methyl ester carboxylesterase
MHGYAAVNGLELYYEVHGSGPPLVLLHGNLSTIEIDFSAMIPALARTRQVIAIEQQGHGHTADIDRPLRTEHWAEDTAALLRHLDVGAADVLGYSSGSIVAFRLALAHPELVRKLVLCSFAYHRGGAHPDSSTASRSCSPSTCRARRTSGRTRRWRPARRTGRC